MIKKSSAFALFAIILGHLSFAQTNVYQVNEHDVHKGYVTEKIWLSQYALPKVSISGVTYAPNVTLPKDAKPAAPADLHVVIGMDRKKPFALIHVPVYAAQSGSVNRINTFQLTVDEQPATRKTNSAARSTDVTTSALANGTWYKIGITQTGFYKIDYNFLTSMGVSPASINPANIRILGNGGHMLSEDNSVARPIDLVENAILVSSSGSTFGTGDYAVFYGVGPQEWDKDSVDQRFTHKNNFYSDTSYYFISFDQGAGLRIPQQQSIPTGNVVNVSSYNYYVAHELDLVNPGGIGKLWYGEEFAAQLSNTTQPFVFDMGSTVSSVYCTVSFAGSSANNPCEFSASVNGQWVGTGGLAATPGSADDVMSLASVSSQVACNAENITVAVTYNPLDPTGLGYLYYIELNARPSLSMTGNQMNFRDWQSVGSGNVANFQLQGANSNTSVWDVTYPQSPVVMQGSLSGSSYSFKQDASMLHEFAAMNTTDLYTPAYSGTVPNQNLHGLGQASLIIVTYPDFLSQAQQLAAYHQSHDNMNVAVATTTQVYNEFSSGAQDISAIRDFAKMFYDRATDTAQMPKYMLLFGGASYDYLNRIPNNDDYVPVYESVESFNSDNAYSTDDFYGFLDDNENINTPDIPNVLDIGIGRLPARTQDDATNLVNKIISYTQPATLGPWRLSSLFVAESNDDAGDHPQDADWMADTVTFVTNNLDNVDKGYIDATPVITTPAGPRCPNINAQINNDVFKGLFLLNYNGHGNTTCWANERVLTQDDFNAWTNANMLPFMVSGTCDFGQFDQPQYVSAGEQMLLRPGGGVICGLITTAAVYATYNVIINGQYLYYQFLRNGSGWNTFGDAFRLGKDITYIDAPNSGELANFYKFVMLGDPALQPDFPQYHVQIDSINDGTTLQRTDTVKALGSYVIYGSVHDNNGVIMNNFNGLSYVSFYDKPVTMSCIDGFDFTFQLQNSIIYKGISSVANGLFSMSFIAPKDINYVYGSGKVSIYAQNGLVDAAGSDTGFNVGGYSDNPVISTSAPIVRPFIGDSLFLNGGITGNNTSLFVELYDSTGINVSGTYVGHDLSAVLDGNVETPYILNDYYETAPNTYQRGYVTFPLSGLADGPHVITVTAWDVNDNVGYGTVNFTVVDGQVVDIQNLMNYPNPFSNTTNFVFEYNQPNEQINVTISIYNTAGEFVKKIEQTLISGGSRNNEISWDGSDNNGAKLPSGVYVYRLNIATETGFQSSAYQKLVIVR